MATKDPINTVLTKILTNCTDLKLLQGCIQVHELSTQLNAYASFKKINFHIEVSFCDDDCPPAFK